MISIALIGGTGTGKSTVAQYLRDSQDAIWLDCDKIGHQLLEVDTIQKQLVATFGGEILEAKKINRKALGRIVFGDTDALRRLNQIMHPPIMKELRRQQQVAEEQGKKLCVLDGALLMDVNVRRMVDEVWAIDADREIRLQRLMQGRGIDRAKAMQIMKNQISAKQYAEYADRVISTNEGMDSAVLQIKQALKEMGFAIL